MVVAASVVAATAAGSAVVLPLALLGAVAVLAAVTDIRTRRIPNRLVAAGLVIVGVAVPVVAVVDERPATSVLAGAVTAVALSGAPILFAIWLLSPAAIGGGDWKLLAVLGAAVGLALPIAAVALTMVACSAQFVWSAWRRSTVLPFAPALAFGYVVAVVALVPLADLYGGPYA